MSNWWDDLETWAERAEDGDYGAIATYTVGETIKANHNILAGIRNNDFDVNDPSYCECIQQQKRVQCSAVQQESRVTCLCRVTAVDTARGQVLTRVFMCIHASVRHSSSPQQ